MAELIAPLTRAKAITLHDSNDQTSGAFLVGDTSGGDTLKITTTDGDTVTLTGLLEGVLYPIAVKVFWTSGSDVASVFGFD